MRNLVEEADAKGLVMCLHVEMNNPILEFYKKLGFQTKGEHGIYHYIERERRNLMKYIGRGQATFVHACLVTQNGTKSTRDVATYCPPLAGD